MKHRDLGDRLLACATTGLFVFLVMYGFVLYARQEWMMLK